MLSQKSKELQVTKHCPFCKVIEFQHFISIEITENDEHSHKVLPTGHKHIPLLLKVQTIAEILHISIHWCGFLLSHCDEHNQIYTHLNS